MVARHVYNCKSMKKTQRVSQTLEQVEKTLVQRVFDAGASDNRWGVGTEECVF